MKISINIDDESLPAWAYRLEQYNGGVGESNRLPLNEFIQMQVDEETSRHVAAHQLARREALIPIANQILAASPAKQQAAIAAALEAIA